MAEDTTTTTTTDATLVDITAVVESCAASLSHKNPILAHTETFSLHDSMSALELMDRKMDCCEVPLSALRSSSEEQHHHNGDDDMIVPPRPLPKGLDDSVAPLPWMTLSLEDASLIAVESLTRLEAMLSGASVAESIYTCLYAYNSVLLDMKTRIREGEGSTPAQQAVYAIVLSLVAIAKIFRDTVVQADIYEEEDFSVQTYGLECLDGILSAESFLDIETGVRCVAAAKEGRTVELVLKFELDFLKACLSMSKTRAGDVISTAQATKVTAMSGLEKLEEIKTLLLDKTLEIGTEAPIVRRCFDPFMYRTLVGNAPVRKVSFRKPLDSISILSTILSEIGGAACDLLLCGTSIGQVRRMLNQISEKSLNILSRSLMVLNLYFDDKFLGKYEMKPLVEHEMKQMSGAPDALFSGSYGQALLTRLAKPVYDTVKLSLLNRNRQQAYLDAAMIPDWASLQQEARAVDMNFCMENQLPTTSPPFFSYYILHNLVWLMDHYVALGVELSLFQGHHDLSIAYWYRDVLLSSLLNTLRSMRQTKLTQHEQKSKGRKKGGKNKKHTDPAPSREDMEDDFDLTLLSLKRALCRGITRFTACLRQAELLLPESFEFTTHEIRFAKRFQPFACVDTPAPLAYPDYLAGSNFSTVKQADLLAATAASFRTAKEDVDALLAKYKQINPSNICVTEEDLRNLAKTCVGNSVYVMKLARDESGGNKPSGKVEFDFDANTEFCIIKIV